MICLQEPCTIPSQRHHVILVIVTFFLVLVPCDAETRIWSRWRRKESPDVLKWSNEDEPLQTFTELILGHQKYDTRNLIMGGEDDDRHNQDPENFDPENPLTWYPTKSPVTGTPTISPTAKPVPTVSPTHETHSPTHQPTMIPSRLPSVSPSTAPTEESHSPSHTPSVTPSQSPSSQSTAKPKSPTIWPSCMPSKAPTGEPQPSAIPTDSPSRAPFTSTLSPSVSVSVSPTCTIDTGTGNYGDVTSVDANVLIYVYEMETDPSSSASISQEVIPKLEKQILNAMIPNYFDNYCKTDSNNARKRVMQISRETGGAMVGISSLPSDKVRAQGKRRHVELCTPNLMY